MVLSDREAPIRAEEVERWVDDILRRRWFTNHGPVLQALERAPGPGRAGLCSASAGVLAIAFAGPGPRVWAPADLPFVRAGVGLLGGMTWARDPSEAAWIVWPAEAGESPGDPDRTALFHGAGSPGSDVLRGCRWAILSTGSGSMSGSIGAEAGVVVARDEGDLQALRTVRNHHEGQTFAPVPIRFNLKMSELQAVAAVLDLLGPEAARELLDGLAPNP